MAEHMLASSRLPRSELQAFISARAEQGALMYPLETKYKTFKLHFVHAY